MVYTTLVVAFLVLTTATAMAQPVVHQPPAGSNIGEFWFRTGHLYIQLDETGNRCKIVTPDDQPDTVGECIQPEQSPT